MRLPTIGVPKRAPKPLIVGIAVIALFAATFTAALYKPQIEILLMGGEKRTIHIPADHFLLDNVSTVKVAGIDVGKVTEVERKTDGSARVTVKVEDGVTEAVGSQPSAAVRPNTLLGGKYYIEVNPGGDRDSAWSEPIPLERTRLPVEVGDIAQALQPNALQGASSAVRQFDKTLATGGTDALQQLLADAPDTMRPGMKVLDAMRGTRPKIDLPQLVRGLNTTSGVLTRREGQLQAILTDMQTTTAALADQSAAVAWTVDHLPGTLDNVNAGMSDLRTTLRKVRDTAEPARPTVQELGDMLRVSDPVLRRAVPVLRDLRLAMNDARPLLDELVPMSMRGTEVLDGVRGPVLDRINGPIKTAVMTPYQGTGPYKHTSGDFPFYKAVGYMFSGLNAAGAYVDANGHFVAFQPGAGLGSVSGIGPYSLEEMFQHLLHGKETR